MKVKITTQGGTFIAEVDDDDIAGEPGTIGHAAAGVRFVDNMLLSGLVLLVRTALASHSKLRCAKIHYDDVQHVIEVSEVSE